MKRALLLNPSCMSAATAARIERIALVAAPGMQCVRTRAAGDMQSLARDAISAGATRILVAGGDGSVHEAANAVHGSDTEIAVLPAGTGNDFARSLGVPACLNAALALALKGRAHPVDAGEVVCAGVNGDPVRRIFLNIAEAGLGGDVVRYARAVRGFVTPWIAYQIGILAALAMLQRAPVSITVDGVALGTFPNSNLIVGNGQYFGSGLRPLPRARLDDGLLDVAHIRDVSRLEMAREAPALKNGIRADHPKVDQRRCRMLRADTTSAHRVPVEADGEWLGYLPATFTVLPAALRVVRAGE